MLITLFIFEATARYGGNTLIRFSIAGTDAWNGFLSLVHGRQAELIFSREHKSITISMSASKFALTLLSTVSQVIR
jgi:hypothetical protein